MYLRLHRSEHESAACGGAGADAMRPAKELPARIDPEHVLLLPGLRNRGHHILGEDTRSEQVRQHGGGHQVFEESQEVQHHCLLRRLMHLNHLHWYGHTQGHSHER